MMSKEETELIPLWLRRTTRRLLGKWQGSWPSDDNGAITTMLRRCAGFLAATVASCSSNQRTVLRCSTVATEAATALHGRVDKIGYVTDLEGDRRLWWKYAKLSKVLEVHPVTTSGGKNGDGRQTVSLKPNCHLVFGGDVNDQYDGDIEVIEELLKLKRKYPDRVHFILGNRDLNKLRIIQELSVGHVKKYPGTRLILELFGPKYFSLRCHRSSRYGRKVLILFRVTINLWIDCDGF